MIDLLLERKVQEGKWKGGRKKVSPVLFTFFLSVVTFHNKSVTLVNNDVHQWHTLQRHMCHFSVFTRFWRYLWPITEQTQGNMESVCLIFHFTDTGETEKIFLRGNNNYLQTSWSAGKLQKYLYSFFMYTVTPLVKADVSWISTHLLKSFPYTILKKRKESKHKGKGMKIQQVCSFNQYIVYVKYCFNHSLRRLNSSGQSVLNPSKNSPDWTWLESRPTYLDRGTMRRSRHDIFSLLGEEFTDYYVDKYLATEPSKNMKTPIP